MSDTKQILEKVANAKVKQYSQKRIRAILITLIVASISTALIVVVVWSTTGVTKDYSRYIYIPNPQAIDGDTMLSSNRIIRIDGINAPEIEQECIVNDAKWNCGLSSKEFLNKIVTQYKIFCITNTIKYNIEKQELHISSCYIDNDKTDLGKYIIQNGFAVAYKKYSSLYIKDEKIAKNNRIGIWNSVFEDPHDFKIRKFRK